MPMTHIVNMHEAKSTLSSLVAKARAGKPVARLVAYDEVAHPRRFGALKDVLPEISGEEWEETDRAIAHLWKR
jgi:antitoxin (DNA-binding transcriptional repressor) of toxin-antitoxin stability system